MGGNGLLNEDVVPHKSASEIFDEAFPFYLSIGMSYAEYWTGDPMLVRYFRKAYKLKQEQQDNAAWTQGLYFYDALQTALGNAFKKEGTPPLRYPSEPYLQKERKKKEKAAEDKPDKFRLWMNNLVAKTGNIKTSGAE